MFCNHKSIKKQRNNACIKKLGMKPQTVRSVMRLAPWKTLHQHLRTQTTKLLTSLDHTNSQHPKVRLLMTCAIAILIIKIICHSQVKHTVWNMLPEPTVSSQRSPSSTKKSSPKFQSKNTQRNKFRRHRSWQSPRSIYHLVRDLCCFI